MKNSRKLARCREEIDAHRATLSSPIRYVESIAQLPYTSACIKKAMRLFPSIGLSMQRHSLPASIELSDIIFLLAGMLVVTRALYTTIGLYLERMQMNSNQSAG